MPGPVYDANESVTRRQEAIQELEQAWWDQWVVQALPHLVPFRRWKSEHRNIQIGDIVLVLYEKKISKGTYKLGRVLETHPDAHGRVRTITVGIRGKDKANALTYIPKPLEQHRLGVQRVAVILPVEDQDLDAEDCHKNIEDQDVDARNEDLDAEEQDLGAEERM